tara:strand:+ start:2629 stop:3477 length:849 start_codon:yes stop_codon:yes gene_type:complete
MALDADLVVDRLADRFVVALGNEFAPHTAFAIEAIEGGIPVSRNTVQVEVSGNASAVQTNSSDYTVGAGTNSNAEITVSEYSITWQVTSQEGLQGHRFATGPGKNAQTLANTVWGVPSALMTGATFGEVATVAEGSFAAANLQNLWAGVPGTTNVHALLSKDAMKTILPTDKNAFDLGQTGAHGFAGIHAVTDWSSAEATTYGACFAPQAFAVVHGAPDRPTAVLDAMRNTGRVETLNLPNGLDVEFSVWADANTRVLYASLALCYGAVVADASAGILQQTG